MPNYNPEYLDPVPLYDIVRFPKRFSFEYLNASGARYTMRAYHTVSPLGHVFWEVDGAPDSTAAGAPYPAGELSDIVVVREQIPGA